ncbi:ATP12 family protein [Aurantimonas sp. Leaf443]|uniref:ATP12 family chaperone protein n=1 Tax=Aurantimonas sp. Leaf443 TaxID=1736378 RepID=UPI0006F24DA8|nr:ATP12 family protein [Aurantimonas sp. Leaf443]KQT83542.1 ATPase [Aurantimonas sp. Leaf443]
MTGRSQQPDLPKRFYEKAAIEARDGGFAILLDGRSLRTPARNVFLLPHETAAEIARGEWDGQGERVDPATMPMTRLANTVIDAIAPDPAPVRDEVARFAETDLLFYRASEPERLVERQRLRWDPVLDWASGDLGGPFRLAAGVMHVAQPDRTLARFAERLAAFDDPFRVAALNQMTTLTGSALLAYAVARGRLEADEAWALAHLDEDWNIEQWGEDAEASARRAFRWEEMKVAALLARPA